MGSGRKGPVGLAKETTYGVSAVTTRASFRDFRYKEYAPLEWIAVLNGEGLSDAFHVKRVGPDLPNYVDVPVFTVPSVSWKEAEAMLDHVDFSKRRFTLIERDDLKRVGYYVDLDEYVSVYVSVAKRAREASIHFKRDCERTIGRRMHAFTMSRRCWPVRACHLCAEELTGVIPGSARMLRVHSGLASCSVTAVDGAPLDMLVFPRSVREALDV